MTTSPFRASALACALLSSTCLVRPAVAQTVVGMSSAPIHQSIDANGVDLATGTYQIVRSDVSIGPAGHQGLAYGVIGSRNNLEASLSGDADHPTVSIGGSAESFSKASGVYVSDQGSGATLVYAGGQWTYTSPAGVVARFGDVQGNYGDDLTVIGWATDLRYPDGTWITYTYRTQDFCFSTPESDGCPLPQMRKWTRIQSITSSRGYQLKFEYARDTLDIEGERAAWSRITKVTAINDRVEACDPGADRCTLTGNWPSATYAVSASGENTIFSVTDAAGGVTRYTGSPGQSRIKTPASDSDNLIVNYAGGKVASVTVGGRTWSYGYADDAAANERTTTVTNPLSQSHAFVSRLTTHVPLRVTDALGRTTSYQYDANERPTRVTAPEGNYTQLSYDARGNVTETRGVAKPGSGLADIVVSAAYSTACADQKTCNKPTSTTDARGAVTDYSYDGSHGGVLTVTAPAPVPGAVRPQTRYGYAYAATSRIYMPASVSACQTAASCANGADEVRTTVDYGADPFKTNFLPQSVSQGNGSGTLTVASAFTYDRIGNLLTIDGPLAGTADTVRMRYDVLRRRVGTVSPDPDGPSTASGQAPLQHRAARTTYDGDGRPTKVERGTVASQTDAAWAGFASLEAVETAYDASGRALTGRLTASGVTHALTQTSYDAAGRPDCTAQRMNPASFGSLPASACSLGMEGSFGPDRISKTIYDAGGRATKLQTALGTAEQADEATSTYTASGQVDTATDGEGNRTTYEYDGHGRLKRTRYPVAAKGANASSTSDYEEFGYDAGGNVVSRRNRADETASYTYDALGRVTLKNLPGSEPDATYGYDNLSRLVSASQAGQTVTFAYDALGRKLSEANPRGTIGSQYDLAGRRTRMTYPDGFFVEHDYLTTGEMTAIRENGANVLASFTYDAQGRRTSLVRGNGTSTSYSYDAASRLASLSLDLTGTTHDLALSFSHNPASQIVGRTASNDAYSWTGHGNGDLGYAPNGLNQMTTRGASPVTHDTKGNMTADGQDRVFTFSSENLLTKYTVPSNGGVGTLGYDPLMRMQDSNLGKPSWRAFVWDGQTLVAEHDSGGLVGKHVHGPGQDEPLLTIARDGRRFWMHADERGSVVGMSNPDGTMRNMNRYDEYGRTNDGAGRFLYTGQIQFSPDLLYYRARFYSPSIGRFVQADPIGYGDGMNMYGYVGGDPVNFTDPSGLTKENEIPEDRRQPAAPEGVQEVIITGTRDRWECLACAEPAPSLAMLDTIASINFGNALQPGGDFAGNLGALASAETTPQKLENQCKSPAVQSALNHPGYKSMLREAWRMSRNRGNIEVGFNFGSYLFRGRGFGDVYPGRDSNTIIFRDDFDSLFADGIWNPDVHFHIHPPGEDPDTSTFDGNHARNTAATVVAISPKGMDCTDGRR